MSQTYKEIETELTGKESNKDGSKNNFYSLSGAEDLDDLADELSLDGFMFNIAKSLFVNRGNRHDGTDPAREGRKCLHYAIRRAWKELGKEATGEMLKKYSDGGIIPIWDATKSYKEGEQVMYNGTVCTANGVHLTPNAD